MRHRVGALQCLRILMCVGAGRYFGLQGLPFAIPIAQKRLPKDTAWEDDVVLFLDCDDCLYQNNWTTAEKLTDSIAAYTARLGVSKEEAFALYEEHGTALKGLLAEGILDENGAEVYLQDVHAIDLSDITPDPQLARLVGRLRKRPWIFTASTEEHVRRCIRRLKLSSKDLAGIIDTRLCRLETKHHPSSFNVAMQRAGVARPEHCLLCDDSLKNIRAAKRMGWRAVLVGYLSRGDGSPVQCEEADFHIGSIHELPEVMPELWN
ncbi:unnamed protein product [Cladocopium goreaui]|uniref:Pyrimidine 5'-nucleotidase n=1 Tax=Cladocopium goreaui TaxID=2562237 RepID=A0A9P1CFL8_9DINO|nr:unnamed protein product [Cladocopium goreaui]